MAQREYAGCAGRHTALRCCCNRLGGDPRREFEAGGVPVAKRIEADGRRHRPGYACTVRPPQRRRWILVRPRRGTTWQTATLNAHVHCDLRRGRAGTRTGCRPGSVAGRGWDAACFTADTPAFPRDAMQKHVRQQGRRQLSHTRPRKVCPSRRATSCKRSFKVWVVGYRVYRLFIREPKTLQTRTTRKPFHS